MKHAVLIEPVPCMVIRGLATRSDNGHIIGDQEANKLWGRA